MGARSRALQSILCGRRREFSGVCPAVPTCAQRGEDAHAAVLKTYGSGTGANGSMQVIPQFIRWEKSILTIQGLRATIAKNCG